MRFLQIIFIAFAPFFGGTSAGYADVGGLPLNADNCAIYFALSGQPMPGCPAPAAPYTVERSINAPSNIRGYYIRFDFGSDDLAVDAKDHLTRLSALLRDPLSQLCVKLVGHTDTVGNAAFNQRLSLKRAQSVRLFFIGPGALPSTRLLTEGRGEIEPLPGIPGRSSMNRRVEFRVKETPGGQCP